MKLPSLTALRALAATVAVAAPLTVGLAPANAEISRSAEILFPYPGSDVTLVNHRGLSPGLPEKTPAAFRNSISMGVDAIEIDMRTTRARRPSELSRSPSSPGWSRAQGAKHPLAVGTGGAWTP